MKMQPRSIAVIICCFLSYLCIGYYPFEFSWPARTHKNEVQLDGNSLRFARHGIALTQEPPAWLARAITAERLTITLEIEGQAFKSQWPARIFEISRRRGVQNLIIDQRGRNIAMQVRVRGGDEPKRDIVRARRVFATPGRKQVRIEIDNDGYRVALNDKVLAKHSTGTNALRTWQSDYQLAVGNGLNFDRAWRGTVHDILIDIDGELHRYNATNLEVPSEFYALTTLFRGQKARFFKFTERFDKYLWDTSINILGFIPLSMIFMLLASLRAKQAVAVCAILSLMIEFGQFLLPRSPSLSDVLLNTLGASIGALLIFTFFRSKRAQKSASAQ